MCCETPGRTAASEHQATLETLVASSKGNALARKHERTKQPGWFDHVIDTLTNMFSKPDNPVPAPLEDEHCNTVFVLDESSFTSSRMMRDFLTIVDAMQPRAILVGDKKQLGAIEAGKPFTELQQFGITPIIVDEVIRQRDPELKAAVYQTIVGNACGALHTLKDHIHEYERDELAIAAASKWLARTPEERRNTLLLAPSNAMREAVNRDIRAGLRSEGQLTGTAMKTTILQDTRLSRAEKTQATNYQEGDTVQFHRAYKRLGVDKGEYLSIEGIDTGNNCKYPVK